MCFKIYLLHLHIWSDGATRGRSSADKFLFHLHQMFIEKKHTIFSQNYLQIKLFLGFDWEITTYDLRWSIIETYFVGNNFDA